MNDNNFGTTDAEELDDAALSVVVGASAPPTIEELQASIAGAVFNIDDIVLPPVSSLTNYTPPFIPRINIL